MSLTILINELTLCHKGSEGVSNATAPDVCKTPPNSVPVAYPNTAHSEDLADGTLTVSADGGQPIAISSSQFQKSSGDEPGSIGGVISGTNVKEATWLSWSFNVRFEGKGACRLTDKMSHNHGNTVDCAGLLQDDLEADCKKKWADIDKQMKKILSMNDPIERNKEISAAYAQLYLDNPKLKWAGMAAFVSKQAGCALNHAQKYITESYKLYHDASKQQVDWLAQAERSQILHDDPLGLAQGGFANTAFTGLADGNKAIFGDIYPAMSFYNKYGNAALQKCAKFRTRKIATQILEALDDIQAGRIDLGTLKIADYEQRSVLQNNVFSRPEFRKVMSANLIMSGPYTAWLGEPFGTERPTTVFSSGCTAGPDLTLPFDGNDFNNPNQRVNFAKQVMRMFTQLNREDKILNAISNIARFRKTPRV